jgi:hypothetical protein
MKQVYIFSRKMLPVMVAVLFFCMVANVEKAQCAAAMIGDEDPFTHKIWVFDYAQTQERPENSGQNYTQRNVLEEEFFEKHYFMEVPVRIEFMDEYSAVISGATGLRGVLAVYVTATDLEFRGELLDEELFPNWNEMSEIDRHLILSPTYFNVAQNENQLKMQCQYYYYIREQQQSIEGILTIHYKRVSK